MQILHFPIIDYITSKDNYSKKLNLARFLS